MARNLAAQFRSFHQLPASAAPSVEVVVELDPLDEMTKALNDDNDLVKAGSGAGSRGGHVIGKTRSGKPIYASGARTKQYHAYDHDDAAVAHRRRSADHLSAKDKAGRYQYQSAGASASHAAHKEGFEHHKDMAGKHSDKAQSMGVHSGGGAIQAGNPDHNPNLGPAPEGSGPSTPDFDASDAEKHVTGKMEKMKAKGLNAAHMRAGQKAVDAAQKSEITTDSVMPRATGLFKSFVGDKQDNWRTAHAPALLRPVVKNVSLND
jgi:hypothetical protein